MVEYQFSSLKMTILVICEKGKIIRIAPIGQKFIGQPLANLESWMRKQGGFRKHQMRTLV